MAHFTTPFNYDCLAGIHKALNGLLPPDIRIREIRSVPPEFHARFSVISKIYNYKIYNDTIMDPFQRLHVYHSIYKLNPEVMRDAAKHFVGKQDFSSFANTSRNDRTPNPVKNIFRFDVVETVLLNPNLSPYVLFWNRHKQIKPMFIELVRNTHLSILFFSISSTKIV